MKKIIDSNNANTKVETSDFEIQLLDVLLKEIFNSKIKNGNKYAKV